MGEQLCRRRTCGGTEKGREDAKTERHSAVCQRVTSGTAASRHAPHEMSLNGKGCKGERVEGGGGGGAAAAASHTAPLAKHAPRQPDGRHCPGTGAPAIARTPLPPSAIIAYPTQSRPRPPLEASHAITDFKETCGHAKQRRRRMHGWASSSPLAGCIASLCVQFCVCVCVCAWTVPSLLL